MGLVWCLCILLVCFLVIWLCQVEGGHTGPPLRRRGWLKGHLGRVLFLMRSR